MDVVGKVMMIARRISLNSLGITPELLAQDAQQGSIM